MIGLSIVASSLSLSGCLTPPEPCNCGVAEVELRDYTQRYHQCLENVGNLRQQVKSLQEKR